MVHNLFKFKSESESISTKYYSPLKIIWIFNKYDNQILYTKKFLSVPNIPIDKKSITF